MNKPATVKPRKLWSLVPDKIKPGGVVLFTRKTKFFKYPKLLFDASPASLAAMRERVAKALQVIENKADWMPYSNKAGCILRALYPSLKGKHD
jgi:hypothetical protein